MRLKLSATLLVLLVVQLGIAQDRVQKIDSLLQSLYAAKKINGNFLIAEKGVVLYQKSFGLANESTGEKLNENSIFELASVSKQFTAMAVMMLQEKGKLKLDDDFTKYLPELSQYKGITILNLINHTSGLPDYMSLMEKVFDKSKIAGNREIIQAFVKNKPAVLFEPSTKYEYSNTGYVFLASIVEKVSGNSFAEFLTKNIFSPLQMKNTFVYNRRWKPKKVDNYAFGYLYSDSLKKYILPDEFEPTKVVVWLDGVQGDGTVNTTSADLLKWDRALYTNKLLSPDGMKQLYETPTLKDGSKTQYGVGVMVDNNAEFGKIINHGGGWPGYKTFIDRHIDNDKTIIMLQNHEEAVNPLRSIRNILYNKALPVQAAKPEIVLSKEQLQKFVGNYEVQKGFEMKITLEGNQLFTQLPGQQAFPIFPETETLFFLKVVPAKLQFEKNKNGEVTTAYLMQNGNTLAAKRLN
ncbi:MAG: serine hydrolase [Pedobacter sp.]|nr:MAG: serine hydrolase [Pedobacter sp.]